MYSVTSTAEIEKLASYQLPASCFAYVGDPAHPGTWKLPYRLIDGSIDERRLPKAIQAILSNYRGVKVSYCFRGKMICYFAIQRPDKPICPF